ncbi:hypothetical protein R1flu_013568 [Riccia fluitans]|uniref:Uncharacterized protein n=1 Tax=Riccia fluitans TaxID=41844 RepID=A0ABD1YHA8_9MARC
MVYGVCDARDYLSGKVRRSIFDDDEVNVRVITGQWEEPGLGAFHTDSHYSLPKAGALAGIGSQPPESVGRSMSPAPVAFYSTDSHYSLAKAGALAGIQMFHEVAVDENLPVPEGFDSWPKGVPCNEDGSMDVKSLAVLVGGLAKAGHPVLICMGNGSSAKRACDDVQAAADLLLPIFQEYGFLDRTLTYTDLDGLVKTVKRNGFWFHLDVGVSDMDQIHRKGEFQEFSFPICGRMSKEVNLGAIDVNSIAMNEYEKRVRAVSTGIYLTRAEYQVAPPDAIHSISPRDKKFASTLVLWDHLYRTSLRTSN